MSENTQSRSIIDELKSALRPVNNFFGRSTRREKAVPAALVDPHGYRLGPKDDFEVLEAAEAAWIYSYHPDLLTQRRLRAGEKFWLEVQGIDPEIPNKLYLGVVLRAEGVCRYYTQKRALLELRNHFGHKVCLTNRPNPLSCSLLPGAEQMLTIKRHGYAWIEFEENIDQSKLIYPVLVFQ